MCIHARMPRLVWSGDGTYIRRRRPWPARGKICACAFLVMMSVLQEVEGLTKELYFIILPVGRPVFMHNFRLNYTVYLF